MFDDGLADVGVEVDPGLEAFAAPMDVNELAVVPTELGVVDAAAFELIEATPSIWLTALSRPTKGMP